jgi:hypothetical protein
MGYLLIMHFSSFMSMLLNLFSTKETRIVLPVNLLNLIQTMSLLERSLNSHGPFTKAIPMLKIMAEKMMAQISKLNCLFVIYGSPLVIYHSILSGISLDFKNILTEANYGPYGC